MSAHPKKITRATESGAFDLQEIDAWMQRRIAYFGKPGLTIQEYRAVVYSLFGLPERATAIQVVAGKRIETPVEMDLPTQAYVAAKMHISQPRVSVLLANATRALDWFEAQNVAGIGWVRRRHGRGAAWEFHAPVVDHSISHDPQPSGATVTVVARSSTYTYAITGET